MQIPRTGIAAMAGEEPEPGLEEIFLGHKDLVFRAAYRITGNVGDAEDVLQTVFLRLLRHEEANEIRNLPAYLHRSAVNASLDVLRRNKDGKTVSLDDETSHAVAAVEETAGPSLEIRQWLR